MTNEQDYPTWICRACGEKYGRGWPNGHYATWHAGECDVCGEPEIVTEPRDYGHLKDDWRAARPGKKGAGKG